MKRARFLRPLTQGHHHGLLGARNIRERLNADPQDALLAGEVMDFQNADLEPHFRAEEELMDFLEPRWGADDPNLARTRKDHADLRGWASSGKPTDLSFFSTRLAEHIHFEEEALFKRFEESLSSEEAEAWGLRFKDCASLNPRIPPARKH
jgi:hemerythrin